MPGAQRRSPRGCAWGLGFLTSLRLSFPIGARHETGPLSPPIVRSFVLWGWRQADQPKHAVGQLSGIPEMTCHSHPVWSAGTPWE